MSSSTPSTAPNAEASPLTLYEQRVAAGLIIRDEAQTEAIQALDVLWHELSQPKPSGLVSLFQKKEQPQGIYIWGGVGRGKTMLMDLFQASLPMTVTRQRWHFHAFMLKVHDFLHALQKSGEAKVMEDALTECAKHFSRNLRVLCFDEMVVRDVADAMLLSRLFETMMQMGTVIVFTSNTAPENLYEGGWQRERFMPFIALIQKTMKTIEMHGMRDFRLRHIDERTLYYAPITGATRKAMRDSFLSLCDGGDAQPMTLLIKGHKVDVPHTCGRSAWFHFNDLCAKPLAAIDYLAICEQFDTIYIDDVPVMNDVMRNEAKRFIGLIDALYDTRRRIVISAQTEPGGLYKGLDHAFEFERAISRLKEMRTMVYWNAAAG